MSEEEEVNVSFEEMCAGHCLTVHAQYIDDVTEVLDFSQHAEAKLHNFKHSLYQQRYRVIEVLRKPRKLEIPSEIAVCPADWNHDLNYSMDEHISEMFLSESPIVPCYAQRQKPETDCVLFLNAYVADRADRARPQVDYYSYAIRDSIESADSLAEAKQRIAQAGDSNSSYNTYARSWL